MLQEPPYFSGTVTDIKGTGEALAAPFDGKEETGAWDFAFFPLFLVDLPFSFVADVLYVPSDYKVNKKYGWKRQGNANKKVDPIN